jgi:RNA polymerase-binding transcription factor DksA
MALTRQEKTELEQVLSEHLEEPAIARALDALHDEEYGHCLDCGADIPIEYLRLDPSALRCVRCQTLAVKNSAHQPQGLTP